MAYYVTSDLHFNHKRIIEFERTQFKDINEHNEYIIAMINKKVYKHDVLYILGDIGLADERLEGLIRRLNGYKILIKGNHDKKGIEFYKKIGFNEVYNHPLFYDKRLVLSHIPMDISDYYINAHGHLHAAYIDSTNHINVNIHMTGYVPVSIDKYLIPLEQELPRFNNKFLHEWFADKYIFTDSHVDVITDDTGRIKYKETIEMRNGGQNGKK